MNTQTFFQKYELPIFFLLTCLLSWWSAPFAEGRIIPYGPAIAALVTLAITSGRLGLQKWWRRVTNWPPAWYWFLVGPAIIVGYQGLGALLNLLAGATAVSLPSLSTGDFLGLVLLGGLWEEPGWSGYLLPRMQARFANRRHGSLTAALVTGVFRGVWHLPLFLYGHLPWFDILIFSFAFQLIIAWVFNRSGGSVPVVMVLHFTSNLMGSFMSPVFAGAERLSYIAWFMALATLTALVIAWRSVPRLGQNPPSQFSTQTSD
jgi:hypothetical protein